MQNKKVVLVTSASSGMGRETTIALAKQGYVVYVAARRLDKLKKLGEYGCFPVQNNPKYSSPPSVIADTVLKIMKSKRPKTTYEVGKTSKQIIWSRKLLSDRILDKMMLNFLKS